MCREYPGSGGARYYAPSGTIYVSNYRLVFVSAPQAARFESFMCTFNLIEGGAVRAPGWLSKSACYETTVYPVRTDRRPPPTTTLLTARLLGV